MRRRHVLLFVLALPWLLAPTAHAADDWPVPRGDSHEPQPFRYDAKLLKDVPKDFLDDAAACVLYSGATYLVEADGTVETINHEVTRLNGRKAIEKLGEYRSITYTPAYQKLTLNVARIHKADGRVIEIEPRHLQLRDVGTDFLVFDRDKTLIISFPSLEVGDTLEVKWTVRGKDPEHGGQFFTRYAFGDPVYPVVRDELCVRIPKEMPFNYAAVAGKADPVITEDGGQRTYRWKALNTPQLPQDENMPPKEELRVTVACSTFPTWEAVGKWKQNLRAECWKCTEDIARTVAEVTKGLTDPTHKARALTYWLRRNIRYVGEGETHEFTPHPPATVFANRFGDCKDTSQLLAVMLREAGLKVELATLGAYDDGQVLEEVPSPWGTHAILHVTVAGKPHWIDTTTSLGAWDYLPHDDRDRLCYLVDDQGRTRLERTPPQSIDDNRFDQTTHVHIGADGSSRCEREVTAYGTAAVGQRDTFLEVPNGERRRQVTSELQDAHSRSRLVKLVLDEAALRDLERPVKVRMAFDIAGHFSGKSNLEGSVADHRVWGRFLAYNLDYDRKTPFVFYAPFESRHRYIVHLPPAYKLDALPSEKSVKSKWGSFTLKVKAAKGAKAGREVELEFRSRIEKARVEPPDFDAFRDFRDDVNDNYRVWLTLKPAQDAADAPLLEAVQHWTPDDALTATILARLYLRLHKDADARRVLNRALAYNPDDTNLWELSVRAAADPEGEEKAQRELVRLLPDEPRHALALGTILVQAGKTAAARAVLETLTEKGLPATRALAYAQLARAFYDEKKYDEALQCLADAAKEDAESVNTVRVHSLRGQIEEDRGRFKDAVAAYKKALAVEPDSDEALQALIRLSLRLDDQPAALGYLRRYSVAVGDDVGGLLRAADSYLHLQHYDEAFELANRVREQTFHEKAQRILGLVYLHRGDMAEAIKHLEKADPDAVVVEALLRAHLALADLPEVPALLEKADKFDKPSDALRQTADRARRLVDRRNALAKDQKPPPGKESFFNKAMDAFVCAEQAHAEGQSARKVEALLAITFAADIDLGPAHALRARLLMDQGKLTRALADADRALALAGRDANAYYVRGRVRLERRQEGALADLEKAAGLSAHKDADVLHYLADALFQAGKRDDAVKIQREAVQLRPNDAELSDQLTAWEKAIQEKR
jgi:tetratricopeptide (TPR) repeat protein